MMIKGDPYDYPFNQDLRPTNTALIVIDMQFDFCGARWLRRQDGL
jgi:hypothetical protein